MKNEFFTQSGPSNQSTLDLVGANWISKVPLKHTTSGSIPLFEDGRIDWLTSRVEIDGFEVLELGSFEGGHTFMLNNAGGNVTAIESNSLSYLKSLVAKELLGFKAKYIYADFIQFLDNCDNFDLVVASGVLYHMENPVELLYKISLHTNRIFIWTHYFDNDFSKVNNEFSLRIHDKFTVANEIASYGNFSYSVVTQKYLESLDLKEFCGGPTEKSSWMFKDDIIDMIHKLGFDTVEVVLENADHKHGPSCAIYAER